MIIPHFSLADRLTQYLNDGVVVAERIDLNPDTLSPTGFTVADLMLSFFALISPYVPSKRIGNQHPSSAGPDPCCSS
jgi:hypothetical protein